MSEEKTSVHAIPDLLGQSRQHNAYLIVISAKVAANVGRMVKLERRELVLGRSTETHFQIDDDGVSRKHAKVMMSGSGGFQLVDLGSTNGTFLNGAKVTTATLADGDKIQIGSNTVLKFSIQDKLEEEFQRSIYESATRDGLTKLYNKKFFLETLRKEFAYCVRHQVPLSIVMFDVDHFKKINDTYGHPAGDYVLSRLAQRVTETIRTEDLLARYGGEEFAVLLREAAADHAHRCAERCRVAAEYSDFVFQGVPIHVTISLGVATLFDAEFAQAEDLIAHADTYLYRAKKAGRNRVDSIHISGP